MLTPIPALLRRLLLPAIALLPLLIAACSQEDSPQLRGENVPDDWPEELVLGFFGGGDADELMERQGPIREYLERELQIPVRLYVGTSYTAVIEAMRANRADAMAVGPFAYILAVEEAGAEAIAIVVSDTGEQSEYRADTETNYFSAIFTLKGSGIETLQDLKGRSLSFVDPASTSGHLAPRALLLENGIDPDRDLNAVFAGSHPTSVFSVSGGRTDAGATMLGYLYRAENEGLLDFCGFTPEQYATPEVIAENYANCPEGSVALIALTDPIPSTPFAIRSNLPQSLKDRVRETLLTVKEQPEFLASMIRPVYYLDPTEELGLERLDQYYNGLREMAKLLELDLRELVDQ